MCILYMHIYKIINHLYLSVLQTLKAYTIRLIPYMQNA